MEVIIVITVMLSGHRGRADVRAGARLWADPFLTQSRLDEPPGLSVGLAGHAPGPKAETVHARIFFRDVPRCRLRESLVCTHARQRVSSQSRPSFLPHPRRRNHLQAHPQDGTMAFSGPPSLLIISLGPSALHDCHADDKAAHPWSGSSRLPAQRNSDRPPPPRYGDRGAGGDNRSASGRSSARAMLAATSLAMTFEPLSVKCTFTGRCSSTRRSFVNA